MAQLSFQMEHWSKLKIRSDKVTVETILLLYKAPISNWLQFVAFIFSVFIVGGLFDLVLYQIVNLPICTLSVAFLGACNYLLESHFLNSLNRLFARPYTIMNRPLFAYQRARILLSGHFLQRATSQYGLAPVAV